MEDLSTSALPKPKGNQGVLYEQKLLAIDVCTP